MNLKNTQFLLTQEFIFLLQKSHQSLIFMETGSLPLKSHILNSLCFQGSRGEVYSTQQSFGKLSGTVHKAETADLSLVCALVLITPRSLWELSFLSLISGRTGC